MSGPFLPLAESIFAMDETTGVTLPVDFSGHHVYFQIILAGGWGSGK